MDTYHNIGDTNFGSRHIQEIANRKLYIGHLRLSRAIRTLAEAV
jgi:hypothetical protein